MSKIVIEDIKKDRRSLREAIPSRHNTHSVPTHSVHHRGAGEIPTKKHYHDDDYDDAESSLSWLWGAIIIVGVVVLLGYFVAPIFTQVTVTVSPKELSIEANEKITATRSGTGEELAFTILPEVEVTASTSAPATGSKYSENKASGKIRITNNFSADPQPLVATTRFTSAKGKIYRIAENVTVPGMKTGKPSTIEVTVYADKAGSDFNDSLTTFTIPGFADSPKFTKITAQSITPMTGGLVGNLKVVASSTEASIRRQISDQLKNDLITAVKSQVPDGFFTNSNLLTISYEITQSAQTGEAVDTAIFSGRAKATAIMLNEADFTKKLVTRVISQDSAKNLIKITNINDLGIKLVQTPEIVDLTKVNSIDLTVIGKTNLLWQIDQTKLKNQLAGKLKNAYVDVFNGYGESIVGGEVSFRPSWSKSFPTEVDRINIELTAPNQAKTP